MTGGRRSLLCMAEGNYHCRASMALLSSRRSIAAEMVAEVAAEEGKEEGREQLRGRKRRRKHRFE